MNLTKQQKDLILLYVRSSKDVDGWADCSDKLFSFITSLLPTELLESRITTCGKQVRLTDDGKTVLKYLI